MRIISPAPDAGTELQFTVDNGRNSFAVNLRNVWFVNGYFGARCRPCGESLSGESHEFSTVVIEHAKACTPRPIFKAHPARNPGLSRRQLITWAISMAAIVTLLAWATWSS